MNTKSGNIAETLANAARVKGTETGLIEAATGRSYTFGELERFSSGYAAYLKSQGVGQGSRVMLMVKPSVDFICLTFALFKTGAPVILIDPGMGYRNLLKCIQGVAPDYLVGIPKAIVFRSIFRRQFGSVKKSFCCGKLFGLSLFDLRKKRDFRNNGKDDVMFKPDPHSLAAIIFTTGSTGPPKGVCFEHGIFATQLEYIRSYYGIGEHDIDQPGFPLFGLFSIALGACAVIPDMDPTRPAQVDPEKFIASINKYGVTYSFGSPAIWNNVANYCAEENRRCLTLKKVLMAGAPVPGSLIRRVYRMLSEDSEIFTPYGATECLPIVSVEGREIVEETWNLTRNGSGTCVGRPLPGIIIKIIQPSEENFDNIAGCKELPIREIGEIIVKGPVVTRSYENNQNETRFSKIPDGDDVWHRIGDMGYLDEHGRLWFCGRKAHRVMADNGIMYTIPCEAFFNEHPDVFRSALVGIDSDGGKEEPAIIVEMKKNTMRTENEVIKELEQIGRQHPLTADIKTYMIHPSFPVDIRHNAKIFREKLKLWAQNKKGVPE